MHVVEILDSLVKFLVLEIFFVFNRFFFNRFCNFRSPNSVLNEFPGLIFVQ